MMIKKISSYIMVVLISGILACSGDDGDLDFDEKEVFNDDPVCDSLTLAQMNEVSDALQPMIQLLSDGEVTASGVTVQVDEQAQVANFTYDDYLGPKSGAKFAGQLDLSNQIKSNQAELSATASFTVTDGKTTQLDMDFKLTLPWDAAEGDFAGPPTDVDGTISLDGAACSAARFSDLTPQEEANSESHFLVAAMQGYIPYSENGSTWESAFDPKATGVKVDLRGIACDQQGACVLVGEEGTVVYSETDGSWSSTTVGASLRLIDVATCAGTWLAVGAGGAMFVSSDVGHNWSAQTSPVQDDLWGVACQDQTFVVGGYNGTLLRGSIDEGLVFIDAAPNPSPFTSVATNGLGVWLAVGEGGGIMRSDDDGLNWVVIDAGITEHLIHVHWGSGRFIAVGQGPSMGWGQPPIMINSDDAGLSWAMVKLPGKFTSLNRPLGSLATDGAGRWIAAGNGGDNLLSTDNGDSWSVVRLDGWGMFDIAYQP